MPLGRQCVDHYRLLNRYNVFSRDEMICNMASKAGTLDVVLASAVHRDMALMIREEKELRDKVKKMVRPFCRLPPGGRVEPYPMGGLGLRIMLVLRRLASSGSVAVPGGKI